MYAERVDPALNTNLAFVETLRNSCRAILFVFSSEDRTEETFTKEGVHAVCVNVLLGKYHPLPLFSPKFTSVAGLQDLWAGPLGSYLLHWEPCNQTGDFRSSIIVFWRTASSCFFARIADLISSSRPLHYVVKAGGIINDECQL